MTDTPKEMYRLAADISNVFPPVRALLETGEDVHIPVILELLETANKRMATLCDMLYRLDEGDPQPAEKEPQA